MPLFIGFNSTCLGLEPSLISQGTLVSFLATREIGLVRGLRLVVCESAHPFGDDGRDCRGQQKHGGQHGGKHGDSRVAPRPAGEALGCRGPPGLDRLVVEEPPQVFGKRVGRCVAPARILVDGLEDDRLEVSREPGCPEYAAGLDLPS